MTWPNVLQNDFDVVGGVITVASFLASTQNAGFQSFNIRVPFFNPAAEAVFAEDFDSNGGALPADSTIGPIVFTAIPQAVPESSTIVLIACGLVVAAMARRDRAA